MKEDRAGVGGEEGREGEGGRRVEGRGGGYNCTYNILTHPKRPVHKVLPAQQLQI